MTAPGPETNIIPDSLAYLTPGPERMELIGGPITEAEKPLYHVSYERGLKAATYLVTNEFGSEQAQLVEENAKLKRQAFTDELTGLPNRRAIMQTLDTLLESEPGTTAMLFVDLDDLKRKNTEGGHEAGDALIRGAAEQLALSPTGGTVDPEDQQLIDTASSVIGSSLRTHDEEQGSRLHDIEGSDAARLGGDEFLVVIRGVRTQEQLTAVNNRIISNLTRAGINASTGAALHQPGQTREELVDLADQAMDQNKIERRARRQAEKRATALEAMDPERRTKLQEANQILESIGLTPEQYNDIYGHGGRVS